MTKIHPSAVIYEGVQLMGDNIEIGPNCIIGAPAEDKNSWGKEGRGVIISNNTIITGNCTIDAGTMQPTYIGEGCFLMKGSHVGHDSVVKDNVTIACHALIGGWCILENNVNIALGAIIHQRISIPEFVMVGMGAIVTKKTDLKAGYIYVGSPARKLKLNAVGLERAGKSIDKYL